MATESELSQSAPGDPPPGIALSPALVMAAALIYTMEADGQGHASNGSDASQLQLTLEGNQDLYDCAADYVDAVALDQFLQDAPAVLRTIEKICILVNVYDSYVSAGKAGPGRTQIFERLLSAFGITEQSFMPYSKTIELKNNRAPLGVYAPAQDAGATLGAHLALASGMVYMVAADGAIGVQERARLAVVTGAFEGLQQAALNYVRRVRVDDFLQQAAAVFDQPTKLHILTNICDTMLSSGDVAPADSRLFLRMLATLGLSGETFKPYYLLLKIKNVKPFDVGGFTYASAKAQFAYAASMRAPESRFAPSRSEDAQTEAGKAGATVWINRAQPQSMGSVRQGSLSGAGGTAAAHRRPRLNLMGTNPNDPPITQDRPERDAGVWVRSDEPDYPGQPDSASAQPFPALATGLILAQFTARTDVVRKDTQRVNQLLDELELKMGLLPGVRWRSTSGEPASALPADSQDESLRFVDSLATLKVSAADTENTLQTAIAEAAPTAPRPGALASMPGPIRQPQALQQPQAQRLPASTSAHVGHSRATEALFYPCLASVAVIAALTVSAWRPLPAGSSLHLAQLVQQFSPCGPRALLTRKARTPSAKWGCLVAPQPTRGRQRGYTLPAKERVSTMAPSRLPV